MREELLTMVTSGEMGLNETILICTGLVCITIVIVTFLKNQ